MCKGKIPELFYSNCINSNCSSHKIPNFTSYPKYSNYTIPTKVILWQKVVRSRGKTQLEPMQNQLLVN